MSRKLRAASDERGFTLVELLAAVTIGAIVIGAAAMLMYSGSKLFNSAASSYTEHGEMSRTVRMLSERLNESNQAVCYGSPAEIRMSDGLSSYAAVYRLVEGDYMLFDFTGDAADFADSSVRYETSPSSYTNAISLSMHIADVDCAVGGIDANGQLLDDGELLEVTFSFVWDDERTQQLTMAAKLLDDWTTK